MWHQRHAGQAAGDQAAQERQPPDAVLGGGHLDAEDLPLAVVVDAGGDQGVHVHCPPALADLLRQRIDPHERRPQGAAAAWLIEGEPGIGKSALVRAALVEAAEAGCEVFRGAGDELGQALPLLPLLEGLRVRELSANPRRSWSSTICSGPIRPASRCGRGGQPGDKLLRLAGGAAGNPPYVTELVAALARSSGVILTGAGTAELTSGSAPGSLSAAIADRLGFVSGLRPGAPGTRTTWAT
jgi:hypothetical protein